MPNCHSEEEQLRSNCDDEESLGAQKDAGLAQEISFDCAQDMLHCAAYGGLLRMTATIHRGYTFSVASSKRF